MAVRPVAEEATTSIARSTFAFGKPHEAEDRHSSESRPALRIFSRVVGPVIVDRRPQRTGDRTLETAAVIVVRRQVAGMWH